MNKLKENMDEGFNFDLPKNRSNVIKVIGVGGGGSGGGGGGVSLAAFHFEVPNSSP